MCFISVLGNNTLPSTLESAFVVTLSYKKTNFKMKLYLTASLAELLLSVGTALLVGEGFWEADVCRNTGKCVWIECKRTLTASSCVTSVTLSFLQH